MTEAPKRTAAEIIAAAKAAKEAQAAAAPAAAPAAPAAAQVGGSPADIIARAKAAAAAKAAAGGAAPAAAPAAPAGAPAGGGALDIIAKAKAAAAAKAAAGGTGAAAGGAGAVPAAAAAVPAGGAAAVIAAAKAAAPIKPPVAKAGAIQPLDNTAQDGFSKARRKFVFASVFGFIGICAASTARFFFPRVLFEPKTSFRIGRPADFPIGVSTKFQSTQRIWVVRDTSTLYVVLAICTHLGCTPDWKESEHKFKCPCHGSGYDIEGVNFEGPAPRPMDRCKVALTPEGEILVDKATVFGPKDWKNLDVGAYLPV